MMQSKIRDSLTRLFLAISIDFLCLLRDLNIFVINEKREIRLSSKGLRDSRKYLGGG